MKATSPPPSDGPEDEQALRASAVFEGWLKRSYGGEVEPFEELVEAHPDMRQSLERLRRMDSVLREAIGETNAADPVSADTRAKMLGDYKILREIGRGAMGIVFEAEQVSLRRRVALKVLPAHLTLDARALARFQREAEISAKLRHRNIIDIHQIGEVAGVHFIAMELVEGTSLDRVIERMRRESFDSVRKHKIQDVVSIQGLEDDAALPGMEPKSEPQRPDSKKGSSSASDKNYIETAVKLIRRVADALDHAHQAGVIHRDIKPSNILVRPDGSAVLTDFGLAREDGLPALSLTGDFAGTPHYVSPEQAMSGRVQVDHRADVFSLGATLYELLTLELPFPGENIHEVLSKIISKQPRDPAKLNPALVQDLVTIVMKALEKDPDRRYPSAAAFAEDLRAFIEYRPIQARRTPTAVRAWRWVKREPVKAVLIALMAIGAPLFFALGQRLLALQDTLAAQSDDHVEAELKRGYLDLGLRRYEEAELRFRSMWSEPLPPELQVEVLAGQTFALLEQERASDALVVLEGFEAPVDYESVVARLRAEALNEGGRFEEARLVDAGLPKPASAIEEYVAGMRLLRGTSYERAAGKDTMLRREERAAEAVRLLRTAALTAERALYYFSLAGATWVARDPEEADSVAHAIARNWKDEGLAWFYVGIAREVFDEGAALEAFEHALALDPDLHDAARRRGILLLDSEPERALVEFARLTDLESDDAGAWVDQAAAFYQVGRFEESVTAAERALELAPEAVEALDTLGSASFWLGRYQEARTALTRALELEPTGARLHNDLGLTLRKLGNPILAREHLTQANELDPENPLYISELAWWFLDAGQPERALELFEETLELSEERVPRELRLDMVWKGIGLCLSNEEALEAFEEAYRLAPDDSGHALNLGGALHEMGFHAEAVGPLREALEGGEGDGSAHEALVRSLQQLGRGSEVLEAAVLWSEAYPDSAAAWNDRAWPQVDPNGDLALRDPEDGLHSARKAVDLSKGEDAGMRDTLAWALFWSGDHAGAMQEEREAIELARLERRELVSELQGSLVRMEELAAAQPAAR